MLKVLKGEVLILGAARTPIGAYDGSLKDFRATDLASVALHAAIERSGITPDQIDEVILGNVVGGGLGQNPAKQAAVAAGIPHSASSMTVNTVCSGGLAAVVEGARAILSGTAGIVAAGGMESRTNAPYLLGPRSRRGVRLRGQVKGSVFMLEVPPRDAPVEVYKRFVRSIRAAGVKEPNTFESLVCPFNAGRSMKDYAEAYGKAQDWTVEYVNASAAESYRRAEKARDEGLFDDEIAPVEEVAQDEVASKKIQQALRAKSHGFCSSYNAPSLGDGAAAVLLAEASIARQLGLSPLARILAFSRVDTAPADFIEAPVAATRLIMNALADDAPFDLLEANESFGLQIPLFKEKIPIARQNIHGGTVALRQPLGATGARILTTLLYALKRYHHRRGMAAICFGSGGAYALAVEMMDIGA